MNASLIRSISGYFCILGILFLGASCTADPKLGSNISALDACGTAFISDVTGKGCVASVINGNNQFWEIAQGETYTVTLSNVTECDDESIGIVVQSSDLGNYCTTATRVDKTIYSFEYPAAANGCNTVVVSYCTTDCSPSSGNKANDANGNCIGHLRYTNFDEKCEPISTDTNCDSVGACCFQGGCTQTTEADCKGIYHAGESCDNVTCPQCTIVATKYYDADGNGTNDAEAPLEGFRIRLCYTPSTEGAVQICCVTTTDANGNATFAEIPPGATITTCEQLPATGTNCTWVQTEPNASSQDAVNINGSFCYSLTLPDVCTGDVNLSFGNRCQCPSTSGKTLGSWSNTNGRTSLLANDPAWRSLLNGLCLRNAAGANYDVPAGAFGTSQTTGAYGNFRTWILGATGTNMAYMLSAQLAATTLNVAYNGLNSNSFVVLSPALATCYGSPTAKIGDVLTAANNELCAHPVTIAAGADRTHQECLKSILDAVNNNLLPTISPEPCARNYTDPITEPCQ